MGPRFQRKTNGKIVSVGKTAGRMDHDYMTYFRSFRVERFLNAKRSKVAAAAKNRSIGRSGEPQIKFALPAFLFASFAGISNHGRRRWDPELCCPQDVLERSISGREMG
jgi:hypothetical protein